MEYLSPTSYQCYLRDPKEFYIRYMASVKPPRPLQTPAMAIGSAFDAYIKSFLIKRLGLNGSSFEEIFESQVEPQNRDECLVSGKYIFDEYIKSGALADLLLDLKDTSPHFEDCVQKTVWGVPLLGKPDIWFGNVVFDWKVNGYYSKSAPSPKPGYKMIYPTGKKHKDTLRFEDIDATWATQLTFYAWILGLEEWMGAVHQVVCKTTTGFPSLRFAQYYAAVGHDFETSLRSSVITLWDGIINGTLYTDEEIETYETLSQLNMEGLPDDIVALLAEQERIRW
jgi:hypothetical protein